MDKTWEDKAHRLIYNLCRASYLQANTKKDGTKYKKHRPYTVPEFAEKLVDVLGWHDRKKAELEAKRLFLTYEGLEATRERH
jgi:hypothetical protein